MAQYEIVQAQLLCGASSDDLIEVPEEMTVEFGKLSSTIEKVQRAFSRPSPESGFACCFSACGQIMELLPSWQDCPANYFVVMYGCHWSAHKIVSLH